MNLAKRNTGSKQTVSDGADNSKTSSGSNVQRELLIEVARQTRVFCSELEIENSQLKSDMDALTKENEHKAIQILTLQLALSETEKRVAEELKRIERLKADITAERVARVRAEKRIREARQQLTQVENRLEVPDPPDLGGGA